MHRRMLFFSLALGAIFMLGSPTAFAADAPAPKLVISGPDEHDVLITQVSSPPGTPPGVLLSQGQVQLTITNEGTVAATPSITAFLDGDEGGTCTPGRASGGAATQTWSPGETAPVDVTLLVDTSCSGTTGTLVVNPLSPGASAATARFRFGQEVGSSVYWTPFLGGLIAALIFNAVFLLVRHSTLTKGIGTGTAWSFKDSWLTNVSALGAVLGSVLAASGFLESVLPGVSTGRLLGLNLLFGGIVLGAPIVFALMSKWSYVEVEAGKPKTLVSQGIVLGVVCAAGATIWGTVGQLLTLWQLAGQAEVDPASRNTVKALLGLAVFLVLVYASRFAWGVTKEAPQTKTVLHTGVSGSL